MSAPPTVSVIIIFLDEERFLEEAIASVLAQTWTDWELLLVDDGSTDGSSAIARRYAAAQPQRIRYLEHEGHANLGMSATRNLGLRHARGELIAFLDGDDVWLPHKLEEQVALMRAHPRAAMVYGRTQYWHSWTGRAEDAAQDCMTEGGDHIGRLVEPPELLRRFLQNGDIYPCTCSIMVRRSVIGELGGFVDRFRDANEDMAFHTRVFLERPVFVADRWWDRYRMHPESFWVARRREGRMRFPAHTHPDHEQYLRFAESELRARGVGDPDTWRALERALWPYRHPLLYRLRHSARQVFERAQRWRRHFRRGSRKTEES